MESEVSRGSGIQWRWVIGVTIGILFIVALLLIIFLLVIPTIDATTTAAKKTGNDNKIDLDTSYPEGGTNDLNLLNKEQIPSYYYDLGIVDDFWKKGYFGNGIKVLTIDTGTNTNHPDVDDVIAVNNNIEENIHGTHVNGIISGNINGVGMVGVAPSCTLYIWDMQEGYDDQILPAFDWAIENGIDVINMSFGSEYDSIEFHQKIIQCRNAGIYLIAAAGNESSATICYPARYPECVAVASIDDNNQLSSFTNISSEVDVVAYGEKIKSANAAATNSSDLLIPLSGTSMATPFVSGLAALILQKQLATTGVRPSLSEMITLLNQILPPVPS